MSAWDYHQEKIFCSLLVADERRGIPQPCESVTEVGVGGVLIIFLPGINYHPTPDSAQLARTGQATTASIAYPYVKLIPGGLPIDDHVHKLSG